MCTHVSNGTLAIFRLYVDDTLLTGGDAEARWKLKTGFMDRFAVTGMDEASRILGITVTRNYKKGTLTIDQKDYVQNTLARFEMLDSDPVYTRGNGHEPPTEQPDEKLLGATSIYFYQTIVGSLLHLTPISG